MDSNQNNTAPRPSADFPAEKKTEPQRDAWGRDVTEWVDVGGKLKPHP